jgi:hypothetical protein
MKCFHLRGQRSLFCGCCCAAVPVTAGLCNRCYRRVRRDAGYFGGHREHVLERDERHCRGCGAGKSGRSLHVHHRVKGLHAPEWLVTLCAACHARVHRLSALRSWLPEHLVELWREQHPGVPVQMQLALRTLFPGQEAVAA